MGKLKVLLLTNTIPHYRESIYSGLAEKVDLTIITNSTIKEQENKKYIHRTIPFKKKGPFYFHSDLYNTAQKFDVVIVMFDISWLSYMNLVLRKKRSYKIILWGIGVSTKSGFGKESSQIIEKARYFIARRADSLLFYSEFPVNRYLERGVKESNIFIAHNTIKCDYIYKHVENRVRDTFLFVGTLYPSKKIDILLESFKRVHKQIPNYIKLKIIGKGSESEFVKTWIAENEMSDRVFLEGEKRGRELEEYFERALATISPGQAGLAVLESFSYGVPFVTSSDAITGGERLNIKNGETGYLFDSEKDLDSLLLDMVSDPKSDSFYENIYNYYREKRQPSNMVDGIYKAIKHVVNE